MRTAEIGASGFSLIEALAAVALTATILIAVSAIAGQWLPTWNRGFVNLQQADLLEIGIERIAEDVSAAEYVTPSADRPTPLFEGDTTSVTFVRSATGPDAYPHLEIVRIAQGQGDRGSAIVRTRQRFAPQSPLALGDPVALIPPPLRVSFAYAGRDRVLGRDLEGPAAPAGRRENRGPRRRQPRARRIDSGAIEGDCAGSAEARGPGECGWRSVLRWKRP